jgi:hypothetical protein
MPPFFFACRSVILRILQAIQSLTYLRYSSLPNLIWQYLLVDSSAQWK